MGKQKIPEAEYRARLDAWLATQGPNTGNGFFGQMSWHVVKEGEFQREFGIVPEMPESTAKPGSFRDFIRHNRF